MISLIIDILNDCKKASQRVIKPSSFLGRSIIENLEKLKKIFIKEIDFDQSKYHIKISRGAGFFPKNPWIAILKKGKKVSENLSVCLCFSKNGNGCVIGLMYFAESNNKYFKTVKRKKLNENFIDINGNNFRTFHNNKFINPIEMHIENLSELKIISHIKESIILLEEIERNYERS